MERLTNTAAISAKRQLFLITWPIFIEVFLQMLMRFSDVFMLSYISDDAVAAIGVVNQVMMFTFVLFNFTAMGSGVVVSQFVGANNPEGVRKTIAHAITINLSFGLFISAVVFSFREQFIGLFSLEAELYEFAMTYMSIVGAFLFAQAMILTVSAILQAMGHTKDVMFVVLIMNALNIFGNYVFIFGALGFPELGVQGVAMATSAMRFLAMIGIFVLLVRRMPIKLPFKAFLTFEKEYLKKILQIGVPAAGEQLSYNISQIVITIFVTSLGPTALATRVYAQNFMGFMTIFSMSISKGMQIFIGQLVGAGKDDEAYHNMFIGVRHALTVALTIGSVLAIFGEQVFGIFSNDPDVISLGATILVIGLILEPGRTSNLVIISALRASGDARFPVLIGMLIMWGVAIPMSYLLGIQLGYGLAGVWVAMLMDEWIRAGIMWWRWRSKRWMGKSLVDRGQDIIEDLER
ncbi:putative MATE family efflux protein [Streptohalobacillus salinus]|uniref:Putative MATE family efflux protein n=1 Tax=Streptohalobacillus salinus TaxID=621096 RepID=A0A2V3W7S6_9BACI|nr:MATE family efflux transporter [Streptohalobacillus salinus]PXW88295.1 putative MATE family efflux protein [Streptohalobacillus salinus]